ncbi:2-amino-4-hydroxy-6-hydroxymethyldihydropteridin epyrophosphokinase [Beutenbergia cavernae DSM 12333]|uniref:Bifunctional folate synthesis protein n=1 Tax=Beutenbergia cavernae (strain ATCC BAA-8 / DSM 12333 / CCUG 43141 / JCM 11478 / NBRC 16432 / NCIMB 13614 / HKI 0122) TaxID=471853 RepID=C5BYK8_BEUC1|nr:2-amino-4-hydroxy-6-hydroxymethyldihydropteridine diphosphokinase [Beutenbergia cavernae]ACQ78966.1 2-amino-4-hydroxy-6-hydroxymethyldihydropteridin epyrophosphokinase [Beutenbergia cavernae DSM 12333]
MVDRIRLAGIAARGFHGVLENERTEGQAFLADVTLWLDTTAAAASDDLADTVSYADVAQAVVGVLTGPPVALLETLAQRVADAVLAYPLITSVEVTLHKPQAPMPVPVDDVELTVVRSRQGVSGYPNAGPVAAPSPAPEPAAPPVVAEPAAAAAVPVAPPGAPIPDAPEPAEQPAPAAPPGVLHARPDEPVGVVLALGGNLGDVRATLRSAIAELSAVDGLDIEAVSPLARTAAVVVDGAEPQPDYLNAVVRATTVLSPHELLDVAHEVERTYGRERSGEAPWPPRTLDIDIIDVEGVVASDAALDLPHPRAHQRAFVLVPWAQLDAAAFLPGLGGGPVDVLAQTAPDRDGVRWLALDWLAPGDAERSGGEE